MSLNITVCFLKMSVNTNCKDLCGYIVLSLYDIYDIIKLYWLFLNMKYDIIMKISHWKFDGRKQT